MCCVVEHLMADSALTVQGILQTTGGGSIVRGG